ncbi:M56 family metallopeptidase [Winogradskyella eximia]|uniref:M56 family metallopeptidase n=1 Tax=Winogradskyella eximia TaxID=262006 RepID=UPI002490FD82|nr:M56 family metallopeptidase [Winogradskyella eximia]
MEIYVLKFSACLLVFWLVYVLFLERQNMHHFKRFYLLCTLALAIIIPTLTVTEYIEPIITNLETAPLFIPLEPSFVEMPIEDASFFNLETTLWLIYGIGVLLFSIRFLINLVKMQRRISKNENIAKRSFIYVLLQENLIPHSFFKYIFFNKTRYESNNIPKEVMLHEETHAKQLHSLDIIILELLQIAFWFHPLIYILKHHVKLNHEFLADQAVLKHGSDAKTYQNILLQFSSNTQNHQLSSAINYSSIKKRFTVMKTQTSKTRIWLSTLLVLPIIAILFYSFAEKEYVEKETTDIADAIKEELKEVDAYKHQYVGDNIVEIYLEKFNQYEILRNDEPHYIHKSESEKNQMEDLFSDLGGIYFRMSKENKANVKRPISPIKPYVQITLKDKTYYKKYKELTAEEKATLPPPPPPTKNSQSYISIQEKPIMVILINRKGDLLINDEQGSISDIESKLKKLSKSFDKSRAVYVKYEGTEDSYKVIKDVKSLIKKYDFKMIHADASQIAPPPPPVKQQKSKGGPNTEDTQSIYNPTFLEYINEMENESASFYLDGEEISAKKANAIATNHEGKRTEMTTQKNTKGKYVVKLTSYEKRKIYARSIELKILNDNSYLIDGKKATKKTFVDVFNQLHQDITSEIRNNVMNIHVSSSKEISDKETWFIYNSLQDYGFYRIVTPNQEINRAKGNTPFTIESHISTQQKATKKQVAEYNVWAKKINVAIKKANADKSYEYPIIKQKDVKYYINIYKNLMTDEQRKNAEPLPQIPPPPPPAHKKAKGDPIEINGATYYFIQKNGKTIYYDSYGKEVDINKIPPPPPIPNNATPEQKAKMKKASDAYMKANPDKVGKATMENGEEIDVIEVPSDLQGSVEINGETFYYTTSNGKTTYFNRYGKEVKMDNLPPPPPAPESTLDFVIRMAKTNAKFFNEGKSISSDKAIDLLKKNPKLNVNAQKTETKTPLIYITKKPILIGVKGNDGESINKTSKNILPMVNGKTIKSGKISMTRNEIKAIKLTTENGKVTEFKFKIPGKPTQTIKSNTLNVDALKNLKSAKKDDHLVLFAFKDGSKSDIAPLVIIITD